MRLLYTTILATLVTFNCLQAQKINSEKIEFEYTRFPLMPLAATITDIDREVVIEYEDEVAQAIEEYNRMVEETKADNEKAKEEWKNKSIGQKFLSKAILDEGKPGEAYIPPSDYFPEIHKPENLEGYIKIDGFGIAEGAPLKISVYLQGFEIGDVKDNTSKKKVKRGDAYVEETSYYKTVRFKHPMRLKVEHEGVTLFDEIIEDLNNFSSKSTGNYSSKSALDKYWASNEKNFLKDCDLSIATSNMKIIQNKINDFHGFVRLPYKTEVYTVKSGKMKYPNFDKALENALTAYLELGNPDLFEENYAKLKQATELWEKEISEHEPDNKKARISDKHVAVAHLNCAQAYCWMNDYTDARKHIMKIKLMNIKKYEKEAEALNDFIDDQRTRYEANFSK